MGATKNIYYKKLGTTKANTLNHRARLYEILRESDGMGGENREALHISDVWVGVIAQTVGSEGIGKATKPLKKAEFLVRKQAFFHADKEMLLVVKGVAYSLQDMQEVGEGGMYLRLIGHEVIGEHGLKSEGGCI